MATPQAAAQASEVANAPAEPVSPVRPKIAPAPQPAMSSARWLVPVLLVVVCGIGGTVWWLRRGDAKTHTAAAAASPGSAEAAQQPESGTGDVTRVDVVHPRSGGMKKTTSQPGSVHPFEYAELEAKVSGYLIEQTVDIGDHVKQEQVLAKLFDPEIVQEAERAKAELELSKRQVDQAAARVKSAKAARQSAAAVLEGSKANVAHYKADLSLQEKGYARIYGLYKQKAIDEKLVDEKLDALESARAALQTGEAAVLTAQAQLSEAEAKIDQAQADVLASKANVQVDEADLAKAKAMVEYTTIKSPYTGVITARNFHVGEFIRSAIDGGTKPLLTVARTDKMRVVFQLPDSDVPYCNPGDPATVTISTLNDEAFPGKIARFAYSESPETRTMRTEVDLQNPKDRLREGMYGNVTVELEPPTKNLSVPSACLVGKSGGADANVYVAEGGKAHLKKIRKGVDNGVEVEVLSGLAPDDLVIMPTNGVVAENQPVSTQLIKETKTAE